MSHLAPITELDYWFKGEDQLFDWEILDPPGTGIQDITGWTMEFRMAVSKGGQSVLTVTGVITDGSSGTVLIPFEESDTISLNARTYHYELWRTNSGAHHKCAHGPAVLQASMT